NQDREVPVDFLGLRHVGNDVALQRATSWFAHDRDRAACQRYKAHDRLEQRRLARAVDANERGDRAARDRERRIMEGGLAVAIGHRHAVNVKAGALRASLTCQFWSTSDIHSVSPAAMVSVVTRSRSR